MSAWAVEVVEETGSTNADLLATALERSDRSVLVARHQTAGRGRLDRRWDAPPGANLLVSFLFRDVPSDRGELMRRIALAAVDASASVSGVDVTLKWPNDLMVGERKLAGVLAERHPEGPVVVGLGLNVGWAPVGAARLGEDVVPRDVLDALLAAFDALPAETSRPRYRQALATLGRTVRVERVDGALEGVATDIEADGRLVVVDACAVTHRLAAGDVVHLRPV